MLRINIYIPEELNQRLDFAAQAKKKVKAEIIRQAINKGLNEIYPKSSSAQALVDLAKMAKKFPSHPNDPKDISTNHNYYAWGGEKDGDE